MNANGQGTRKNYKIATEWYEKASLKGDTEAQINLGDIYADGRGVSKNVDVAVKYYSMAASKGDQQAKFRIQKLGKSVITNPTMPSSAVQNTV